MRNIFTAVVLFFSFFTCKAVAQDVAISYQDLSAYINKKVTLATPVRDFDIRKNYIYLYMDNPYPNQSLTVIIKRYNGKHHIRLDNDIILGHVIAPIKGFITTYNGDPDTTKNYDDADIKKAFEKKQRVVNKEQHTHGIFHRIYQPRTAPIDLRGKPVMFVTIRRQIRESYPLPMPSADSSSNIKLPATVLDN